MMVEGVLNETLLKMCARISYQLAALQPNSPEEELAALHKSRKEPPAFLVSKWRSLRLVVTAKFASIARFFYLSLL
jgi:hypothetical protein